MPIKFLVIFFQFVDSPQNNNYTFFMAFLRERGHHLWGKVLWYYHTPVVYFVHDALPQVQYPRSVDHHPYDHLPQRQYKFASCLMDVLYSCSTRRSFCYNMLWRLHWVFGCVFLRTVLTRYRYHFTWQTYADSEALRFEPCTLIFNSPILPITNNS